MKKNKLLIKLSHQLADIYRGMIKKGGQKSKGLGHNASKTWGAGPKDPKLVGTEGLAESSNLGRTLSRLYL